MRDIHPRAAAHDDGAGQGPCGLAHAPQVRLRLDSKRRFVCSARDGVAQFHLHPPHLQCQSLHLPSQSPPQSLHLALRHRQLRLGLFQQCTSQLQLVLHHLETFLDLLLRLQRLLHIVAQSLCLRLVLLGGVAHLPHHRGLFSGEGTQTPQLRLQLSHLLLQRHHQHFPSFERAPPLRRLRRHPRRLLLGLSRDFQSAPHRRLRALGFGTRLHHLLLLGLQ
mmetsp:Transcript_28934/g.53167  ORF Transcript_28934/g.53167 Transcript_28934/m.53167 type:complete len:221 (+) Transcript_28934:792-1454(+)